MPENDAAERAVTKVADSYGNLRAVEEIASQFRHEQDAEGVAERIVSLRWCSANLSRAQWITVVTDLIRKGRADG